MLCVIALHVLPACVFIHPSCTQLCTPPTTYLCFNVYILNLVLTDFGICYQGV